MVSTNYSVAYLNTAGTPSATASGVGGSTGRVVSCSAALADDPPANDSRSQEEDSCQKGKCHVGLIFSTGILRGDISPSPDGSTVVVLICVGEKGESHDPEDEEDQVHGPFGEGCQEW